MSRIIKYQPEPYFINFEMDGLPKNLSNARVHWALRAKYNREATATLNLLITRRYRPATPLKRATLTMVRHSSVAPDPDGLVTSFKSIVDGLRYLGVIENDRFTNLGFPRYGWKKAPAKAGKIQIVVQELPSDHVFDDAIAQCVDADCR